MYKKYLLITLIFVILISGCIDIDLGGIFGTGLNIPTQTIQYGNKDTIVINDMITIPYSPIIPDSEVLLSFILENKDDIKNAERVVVDLFDAPTFKDEYGQQCNSVNGQCLPEGLVCSELNPCKILPGEQKPIKFYLTAPNDDEIVNIKTQPRLNLKVLYDFESTLFYVFPVITMDEIIKQQQAGETIDLKITKSHGSGPVQIDVEMLGERYALADKAITLNFKIKNVGNGNLMESIIPKYGTRGGLYYPQGSLSGLEIVFPEEFDVIEYPQDIFTRSGNTFRNTEKEIDVYRDESRMSLRFKIELKNPDQANPFKSFEIRSNVNYVYELRESVDITIKPFQTY